MSKSPAEIHSVGNSRSYVSRKDFLRLAGLAGAGVTFAPGINKIARVYPRSERLVTSEWPPETLIWEQKPESGISQFSAWESGYDNDPFPGMLEFKADPKGIFPHAGLWCHIPQDLALEDWDLYREQLMGEENIVLNDWIVMWEDNRNGEDLARVFIESHLADMAGVPSDPQEREAFLDFWAYHSTLHKIRVYPSPMKDFDEIIQLPCRVEVDFWLGDDWAHADGGPFGDWPAVTNVLSVFDGNLGTYYPIALVDLIGPLDNAHLLCRSSGDPRPGKDIQTDDTTLELTYEGQTRPMGTNTPISIRCDLYPGKGRDFLVYVRDGTYDPDYVLYAFGQYTEAAYPWVVSTHSGLYSNWDEPGDKMIQGTLFLGGYRVWSNPEAQPPEKKVKNYIPIILNNDE